MVLILILITASWQSICWRFLGFSHLPRFKTLVSFDHDPICSAFLLENPHECQAKRVKKSVWKDRSIGLLSLERIANGKVLYIHIATQRWCSDLQFLHPGALTCICGWQLGFKEKTGRFHYETEIKKHLKVETLVFEGAPSIFKILRCMSKNKGMVCWLMAYLLVSRFIGRWRPSRWQRGIILSLWHANQWVWKWRDTPMATSDATVLDVWIASDGGSHFFKTFPNLLKWVYNISQVLSSQRQSWRNANLLKSGQLSDGIFKKKQFTGFYGLLWDKVTSFSCLNSSS